VKSLGGEKKKMKKIVAILMAMLMVMSVTVVFAGSVADKDTEPKVPVIIGFKDTPKQADKDMIRGYGGDIKYSYTIISAIAAKLPMQAIDKIKKNHGVAYVEMDGEVHLLDAELDNSWGVKRIGAGIVHGYNKGAGINVSIIDTGIDYTHEDLDANYKGGYDFVNDDADPMDDNGHGTHCAGIVAAEDNGEGVVGVAPEAHLYAVKVLDSAGSGYLSDVIAGIQWSIDNGMQVISMSLGTDTDYQSLHDACDAAYEAGIVLVAAAGNDYLRRGRTEFDTVDYPARYDSVIAVGATDSNDEKASFSSTGADVELAAPGVDILSTYPGGYEYMSGTSMACPHVAGTAALVMVSEPTFTNSEVRQRLQATADDLGAAGFDYWYGYGLVDADEAAALPDTTPPGITNVTASDITSNSATIAWNTDEPADSLVKYGTEPGNYTLEAYDSADVTSHSVGLAGLLSNTTYYYVVNSTDLSGNSAQSSGYNFTTKEAPGNTMHVASIDMSTTKIRLNGWYTYATAAVTIVDADGKPVEGATVSGHWSGLTSDSDSGTTDGDGTIALDSDSVKNADGTFTFTVDNVTKEGWVYDPSKNVETSDSITV